VDTEKKSHLRLGEAATAPVGAQIAFDLIGHGARARAAAAGAHVHSEGFEEEEIDEKTCRKRQVLSLPESGDTEKL
jgi:hypothetical protein